MYVRMSYWSCKPEYRGEDARLFESGAVAIMSGHKGFVRAMLLGEEAGEQRIAFTVWSDAEAYRAFVRSPDLEKITTMFAPMYVDGKRPGPVKEYEVRAQGAAVKE